MKVDYLKTTDLERHGGKVWTTFQTPPDFSRLGPKDTIIAISLSRQQYVAYAHMWSGDSNDNIEFLRVAKSLRGQQIGCEKLSIQTLRACFEFCALHSKNLGLTTYTPKGRRSLPPLLDQVRSEYPNVTTFNMPGGA